MLPQAARQAAFATFALLLGLLASGAPLRAASPDSALGAYEQRDFARARAEFEQLAKENPADPRLRFNAGTAAYRQRDFTNAAAHFESLLGAPDLKLQQGAYYNLGNTRYLLGETTRDPQAKLQAWQQSLTNFSSALKLDPKDTNAASNHALMQRMVEELLKHMPKQQQPQQGDQNKDKDKQEPKDDQSQSQEGQQKGQQKGEQKPSPGDQQKDQQQAQQPDQKQDQGKDGQPEEEKSQQAKAEQQKAEEQKAQQQAGKEPGKEGSEDGEATAAEEAGKPGEMTPAQAARLLDNQKGEEKALVFQTANGKEARERPQRIRKPW